MAYGLPVVLVVVEVMLVVKCNGTEVVVEWVEESLLVVVVMLVVGIMVLRW